MPSISNVEQIVAVIRQQLSRLERGERATARKAPAPSASERAREARPDPFAVLAQRVRAIGRDDPDRGRKAFRLFLESVLLSELDASLVNDPQFYRLVDDVQRRMESDAALAGTIDAAVAHLLA